MSKLLNGNIRQLNMGEVQGTLYNSFNLDLSYQKGKISLAPRTRITTNTVTDLDVSVGFVYFDGFWWTVSGSYVWKATNPQGAFAKDASNSGPFSTPSDCDSRYSDIRVFNNVLVVSTQSRIYRKAANGLGTGGWDTIDTGLSNTIVRPLAVYNSRLYWTRTDNTIVSCDTAYTISDTSSSAFNFTFPVSYKVTFIKPTSTGLFVGIITTDGTEGFVIDWNAETKNTFRYRHNVYAQGALAAYVDNSFAYVMNSNAEVLQFNGSGFTKIQTLPVRRNALYNANATGSSGNDRFIHPNGMTLIDGRLSMLVNARNNDAMQTQEENLHSGIWEYLPDTGSLYHKYSMSYNTIAGTQYDNGQIILKGVGGLTNTPDLSSYSDAQKGNFLCGASFYSDATTVGYGIFTDNYYDNEQKAGFFSTVQIRAQHFADMWNRITTLYTPTAGMSMVWKYRTTRTPHTDFAVTWSSDTTFTTTQAGIEVGDEITIIQGKGSGRIAHVSSISFLAGTYTVVLDETVINVSGTAKARLQKWKKIGIITNIAKFFQETVISQPSTLIELKAAVVATGETTIDELILDNKQNQ